MTKDTDTGPRETDAARLALKPAAWVTALAFVCIYLSWGTTYLATKEGVKTLPPFLFAGVRATLAGALVLGYISLRKQSLRLAPADFRGAVIGGLFLFVSGNGMINIAAKTVDSGVISVLVATTPLWMALLETLVPWGERLAWQGWLGLFMGLVGVSILLAPRLQMTQAGGLNPGPFFAIASSLCWAFGSFLLRHRKRGHASHLAVAAYQMIFGGIGLCLAGISFGETGQLSADRFTPSSVFAFFYLLVVGSLIGFVAFNWLLAHVSTAMVGTYAYVNPLVAILVGALIGGEEITGWIIGGMVVILSGVALVRLGAIRTRTIKAEEVVEEETEPVGV